MADEHVLFWEKKLVENRQILAMLDSGQFRAGDGGVIDAQTLAEVRKWAKRRVAAHVQGGVVRLDEFCCMVGSWYHAWSIPTASQTMR